MPFELPKLPYAYNALEPHIDAQTMEIHYSKHHQTYLNNLNAALQGKADLASKSIEDLLSSLDRVPSDIRGAVNFNGGGYDNHNLFWRNMKPGGGGEPEGELADAIRAAFGSFASFKEQFSKAAVGVQGSGWCWLVTRKGSGKVEVKTMPNQDSPRKEGLTPLFGLDVWEHAYYLKYQNRRADYVSAWWNVVNWDEAAQRFRQAK